jgi:site-specific recombinase XerD
MLESIVGHFLTYCNTCNFGARSLAVFSSVLTRLDEFVSGLGITSVREIRYPHLLAFVSSGSKSVHLKKQRVWALHQFYHFLTLTKLVRKNIAGSIPYPKIDKKEPPFLTVTELRAVLRYFLGQEDSKLGSRNILIVLLLVFLGLRVSGIVHLDVRDIDLNENLIFVRGKGDRTRVLPLPRVLSLFLDRYICGRDSGPLFVSGRNRRISPRMIQHIIADASRALGMNIHSHCFRHTAATHLNRVSGIEVTQHVLGHRRMENTRRYVHLNPDMYAEYMRRHSYMTFTGKEESGD